MNAPWFSPAFAPLPGIVVGIAGGVFGCLAGFMMSSAQNRAKGLTLLVTICWVLLICSVAILLFALTALALNQPQAVWRALFFPGIAGTAAFALALPAIVATRRKPVPNQLPDPTSPSVTPPARAGDAPSVAADH